ncbi:MAG: hypothetical protein GXP14_14190 [Gammaproteobacteria bacterium]|nr:hypothetical protein [Gammaproteobacteria bacterium]
MAINALAFRQDLYSEHMDEASFLYENRLSWLHDEEVSWLDLEELDVRMDAHLDALVVGGQVAVDLCQASLEEAESGKLHVIVRLYCRLKEISLLSGFWGKFDFDDEEKSKAVADALKWDCPVEWHNALRSVFQNKNKKMFSILFPVVVYQQIADAKNLCACLPVATEQQKTSLVWSIGNMGDSSCKIDVSNYLTSSFFPLAEQAALSLMKMGDVNVIEKMQLPIGKISCITALGGNKQNALQLIDIARQGKADADCLIALGLTGVVGAISFLLNYLKHPDYANSAAWGLQLISGASLYEDIHVADEVEEADLFDHELEDFKNGKLPKNVDGLNFGDQKHQLTIKQDIWLKWFQDNESRFTADMRYRNGEAYTPSAILNVLVDFQTPYKIRKLIYDELIIRYNLDVFLAVDDMLKKQKMALNSIHQWVSDKPDFKPGGWYFSGFEQV